MRAFCKAYENIPQSVGQIGLMKKEADMNDEIFDYIDTFELDEVRVDINKLVTFLSDITHWNTSQTKLLLTIFMAVATDSEEARKEWSAIDLPSMDDSDCLRMAKAIKKHIKSHKKPSVVNEVFQELIGEDVIAEG